jgi:hypothetical protein
MYHNSQRWTCWIKRRESWCRARDRYAQTIKGIRTGLRANHARRDAASARDARGAD